MRGNEPASTVQFEWANARPRDGMNGRENCRNSPSKNPHIAAIDGAITETRDGLDGHAGGNGCGGIPQGYIGE